MKRFALTILVLLSFVIKSQAQETWSLEKCINQAIQSNLTVKQSMLNVESANSSYQASKYSLLPNLNGNASHGYNWGRRVDPFTNTFATDRVRSNSLSISSSVTLFSGLSNINRMRASRYSQLAAAEDVEQTKNDISLLVASSYLTVLFNEEILTNATNQLDITTQQLDRVQKMVDAGQSPQGDLLDLQAALANDELNVIRAENSLSLSYLSLTQTLMLDPTEAENFRVEKPNLTELEASNIGITADEVYRAALSRLPQIKAAEYRLQSAERSMASAKGGASPSISLFASYGSGYSGLRTEAVGSPTVSSDTLGFTAVSNEAVLIPNFSFQTRTTPFGDQIRDNVNTNVNISLSVPIFNGWAVKNNSQQARISHESARLTQESTMNTIRTDVYQSHADAVAALRRFQAAKRSLQAREEAFKYARIRYEQGLTTSIEFNDSKNSLNAAQSELVQARYDYLFKTKILDFYQGKPLGF